MADYKDAGHRPHGVHTGEPPRNEWDRGPYGITVTLDTWGPQDDLFTTMYDALQSNWGDAPSRSAKQQLRREYKKYYDEWIPSVPSHPREREENIRTGWARLTDGQRDYVESCFKGQTLPQVLEMISFEFTIDGVSRAFTHQNVRTRIGAAFMQHGGRDNDWRHRKWTMPETIYRACDLFDNTEGHSELAEQGLSHCITNPTAIEKYLEQDAFNHGYSKKDATLQNAIENYLGEGRMLYSALVDAGIPWQDARRVLWMGTQTYIHDIYNYLAVSGMLSKRLEHVMDWEINAVAQLMVREIRLKCHPLIGKYLMSQSDRMGKAAFAGLESWPPDGKYPNPYARCAYCGHSPENHTWTDSEETMMFCEVCERSGSEETGWPKGPHHFALFTDSLPRTHRREQMPFWVLSPNSLAGGPIAWIPTNGQYPKELK